ncbi:MAG: rhomboid family intramembrane serine protease [Bacteroidaceae bacterium]|nr:rhomboid family intramembrane serine protease [Bacteroidaceae bacterium]
MMSKAVKWLLIANIAVYVIGFVINVSDLFGLHYVLAKGFLPWQPITYMFVHSYRDMWHIVLNMFALWMFGRTVEPTLGTKRFLIYYFVCGLAGAIAWEAGQLFGLINPYSICVGASGAIYGILLAFGMLYPNERIFIIPIPIPIKAKWLIIGYVFIELGSALFVNDLTAHTAHLAGMLAGFIMIMFWKKTAQTQRQHFGSKTGGGWHTTATHPNMEAHYNKSERQTDWEYNAQRKAESEEIDRILDKIRRDGYGSLTESEKQQLFNASKK